MLGNHASQNGGGLSVSNGLLRVVSCLFQQNTALNGGGIYCYNIYPVALVNSVITDNNADSGDGVYFDKCYKGADVIHCTLANNLGQGVMFNCGWGTLINSLVWNNGENVAQNADVSSQNSIMTISCRIGHYGDESGVEPAFYKASKGDYHLMANSSLIDRGRSAFMPSNDCDKVVRWDDPAAANAASSYDIGAYEFADTDADQLPDYWEMLFFDDLSASAATDHDGDGLLDVDEYLNKANPLLSDTDGDGQRDGDETVAGTDLNNPLEFLGIDCVTNAAGKGFMFSWDTVSGRIYSLLYTTNLLHGWSDVMGHTNMTGTGYPMSYTNTATASPSEYYRVRVQIQ